MAMSKIPLSKFEMGYFILYRNDGSLFGNAIVKKQLSAGFNSHDAQVTHVETSGGEIHSVNISPPISKLVDITEKHKGRYVYLVRFKNQDYEDGLRYKVAYFSGTLCNKGYDLPGIFAFVFKWVKQNNRLYFCSEGALWALQMGMRQNILNIPPEKCMPAHFLSNCFEVVWQGLIE